MRGITNTNQIYQHTPISKDEGLSMRGIAILCIIFHNFLHLTLHTGENEFTFLEHRAHVFTSSIANNPSWLLADIMSFLGWYGVPIFLFLSGYGLVRKFEGTDVGGGGNLPTIRFIANRWSKLFKLMLIPMLIMALLHPILNQQPIPNKIVVRMLSLTLNITQPDSEYLGVYWFFGLIFELYVLYRLFIYRRPMSWIIGLNIAALATFVALWLHGDILLMSMVRHNLMGWILPFTIGVVFARYDFSKYFQHKWRNIAIVLLAGPIIVGMNFNAYLWYFSSVVAIIAALALAKLWRGGMWLGAISSFLFVAHPIVRKVALDNDVMALFGIGSDWQYTTGLAILLALYFAVTIPSALLFQWIHKRLFA